MFNNTESVQPHCNGSTSTFRVCNGTEGQQLPRAERREGSVQGLADGTITRLGLQLRDGGMVTTREFARF